MKRTLCVLLSLMLALTGIAGLCVPAAAEYDAPFVVEDFEGTYSIGRCAFNANGGMLEWESEPGDYDLVTGHYRNGDGSSRGGNESAEIVRVGSGDPIRFGAQSLKLNYDFTGINGIEGASVGFTEQKEIPGEPTGVGLWFYNPEGGRNFWLRIRVIDGSGTMRNLDFTRMKEGVNWFGWKYIECDLTSYHGPFKIPAGETIRVMHSYGAYDGMGNYLAGTVSTAGPDENSVLLGQQTCRGSVYLDNLQFVYGTYTPEDESTNVSTLDAGDTFRFGSYPQSRVTDDATIAALDAVDCTMTSYGYMYYPDYEAPAPTEAVDMSFADIRYQGALYRKVTIGTYRPSNLHFPEYGFCDQEEHGYSIGTYYFKWEPIVWQVLAKRSDGVYVMSRMLLDAQPYHEIWEDVTWKTCSLRTWLNDGFYNAAFTADEQANIVTTTLLNEGVSVGSQTTDRLWLLSQSDSINSAYGFQADADAKDSERAAQGTDYAKIQGSPCYDTGTAEWWLRFNDGSSKVNSGASREGQANYIEYITANYVGVRPAFKLSLTSDVTALYKTGDHVEFGSYPQSRVTDDATINTLNAAGGTWQSYGYYSGKGNDDDGQMTASDYMQYCDVTVDGQKYRGVTFSEYRPRYTGGVSAYGSQFLNGYETGAVYWFRYEPLRWRVLDPAAGLVLCETVIDSQPFNNYVLRSAGTDANSLTEYWGDANKTHFANNYAESSLRQWLNNDFRNTAFTAEEEKRLVPTTLDNSDSETPYSAYNSAPTTDKVFLLSKKDAVNEAYGFRDGEYDPAKQTISTDYANCQGVTVSSDQRAGWRLRSPGPASYWIFTVDSDGWWSFVTGAGEAFVGVRPAITLDLYPEHVHTYGEPDWDWADDYGSATATFTCADCGDEQTATDDEIDVTVITAEDCTNDRVETYTASVTFDGADYTDTTDEVTVPGTATDHNWQSTWSKDGANHWHDCTRCDEKNDEAAHTYGDVSYTWEQTGYTWKVTAKHTCTVCEWEETETVNATGAQSKAPTCTVNGETTYTATFENAAFTTQQKTVADIAALDHDWKTEWSKDGANHWHDCTRCDEKNDEAAHTYGEVTYTWEQTRGAWKATAKHTCTVCEWEETETVNATGAQSKAPACTVNGETTYTAAFTNTAFETQQKTVADIAALDHDWKTEWSKDGANHWHDCSRCDEKNDEAAHTYGEVTYTWEQTGYTWKVTAKHTCTVCEWEETETVTATGAQSKAPACTVKGETTYTAAFTNTAFETQQKTVDDIDALDHAYDAVVTEPTCTEDGYTTHTCSRCGDSYTDSETEKLGHAFGEWEIVRIATPDEKGEKKRVCTRCGETETAEIDELILTSSVDGQSGSELVVTVPYAKRGAVATQLSAEEPVTYTTSDAKLLTVDENGNVRFARLCIFCRSATITTVSADGSKVATCTVKVEVKWWQYIIWFFLGSLWF